MTMIFNPGIRRLSLCANNAAVIPPPITQTSLSWTAICLNSSEPRRRTERVAQSATRVPLHPGAVAEVVGVVATEVERHQVADDMLPIGTLRHGIDVCGTKRVGDQATARGEWQRSEL